MGPSGKTFRVFVSSAFFSDMHAEREVLQRRVFPRLQRFCQRRGAHFLAVDLRWGGARSHPPLSRHATPRQ